MMPVTEPFMDRENDVTQLGVPLTRGLSEAAIHSADFGCEER